MPKTTSRNKTEQGPTTAELDTIHIGKLNGGYVILVQDQWDEVQELLERAGYKLNFTVERLMHGTSEGDVQPGRAKTASASSV